MKPEVLKNDNPTSVLCENALRNEHFPISLPNLSLIGANFVVEPKCRPACDDYCARSPAAAMCLSHFLDFAACECGCMFMCVGGCVLVCTLYSIAQDHFCRVTTDHSRRSK